MKPIIIRLSIVTIVYAIVFLSCAPTPEQSTPSRKAVFIIVDGIAADVIESIDPPALRDIAARGGYTRAFVGGGKDSFSETPTISAVGYNSLLTGTWAHKHNVWDNDIADPNYHYQHIFRIVKEHTPAATTAIFSTWTDNRTKLIGEGLPQAGKTILDYKFDGLELDTLKYPHDENSDYIRDIDEAVANEAARYIKANGPDLSWVYLQYTDDMGHMYGDSERFYNAVRLADDQVGRIWSAVQYREKEFGEDWLIIVTTDHGRDAASGRHHGGQSERERSTWIITNADNLNTRFGQVPGIVDIMPSLANHLGVPLPEAVAKEIDGVPFIGVLHFSDLKAELSGDKVGLTWMPTANESGRAEVLVTNTNEFAAGGEDTYTKAGDVDIASGKFSFTAPSDTSFLKILLKGPGHFLNTWVVQERNRSPD